MISSLGQAIFIRTQHDMSEQEKKWQRIYDLFYVETKQKSKKLKTKYLEFL